MLLIWFAFGNPNSNNQNSPFISIITADATEMDLQKTQEVYREMGGTLIVNELTFDEEDRLHTLNITSLFDAFGECTSYMDYHPYSYLAFEKNASINTGIGCGFSLKEDNFALVRNSKNWDFIFINGHRPTQERVDKLIANTKKWRALMKAKLKNTSPKTTGTTTKDH